MQTQHQLSKSTLLFCMVALCLLSVLAWGAPSRAQNNTIPPLTPTPTSTIPAGTPTATPQPPTLTHLRPDRGRSDLVGDDACDLRDVQAVSRVVCAEETALAEPWYQRRQAPRSELDRVPGHLRGLAAETVRQHGENRGSLRRGSVELVAHFAPALVPTLRHPDFVPAGLREPLPSVGTRVLGSAPGLAWLRALAVSVGELAEGVALAISVPTTAGAQVDRCVCAATRPEGVELVVLRAVASGALRPYATGDAQEHRDA